MRQAKLIYRQKLIALCLQLLTFSLPDIASDRAIRQTAYPSKTGCTVLQRGSGNAVAAASCQLIHVSTLALTEIDNNISATHTLTYMHTHTHRGTPVAVYYRSTVAVGCRWAHYIFTTAER